MSYADNYEQAFRIMQNIRRDKRRDETMKDKMTEEQAKLYAALLWEELCKPEYHLQCAPDSATKKAAAEKLVNAGILPESALTWGFICPYCVLYHRHTAPCPGCPYDKVHGRCTNHGPYNRWQMSPGPETARAMADFCWSVYRRQDGGGKERKACACCKDEKSKAVRFEVGDRVKLGGDYYAHVLPRYPVWGNNNIYIGGTVENVCDGNFDIRLDNGELNCHFQQGNPGVSALTPSERLMLARRPIRPGDVFKYWNDEELRTLVVVSDGSDSEEFYFLDITDPDSPFVATDSFSPCSDTRGVEGVVYYHYSPRGYHVYFEGLVPVGRMKWSVEPKA